MRIGVDLDNTIFCTSEQYNLYAKQYIMQHNITEEQLWNNKAYRVDFIRINLEKIFGNVKLKSGCLKTLKKLKKEGHEIVIVTARNNDYCDDVYTFTKNNIDKYGIPYDKLIVTEKYKLTACIDNQIDIMIDDSMYIISELSGTVNCLLYDDKNNYPDFENKVKSWAEVYDKIGGN